MWNIVFDFIVLLCGAGSFHHLLCAPHPSHIAANSIGDAGCIALSSCLVHLSHLKVLNLGCKFVVWSGAFVVTLLLGADFVLLIFGMSSYEGGGFCFHCDFVLCCLLFALGDAKFVMMMSSTPAPACVMIAGIDAHVEYCC